MIRSLIHIRKMEKDDLNQVMDIENELFTTPWSLPGFEAELSKKYGINLVIEVQNQIVGYLIAWKIDNEMHIANLAVTETWQNQGIATALMDHLESDHDDLEWMGLEVRESNLAARALYNKLGFSVAGIRPDYYADDGEDAVLMYKEFDLISI